MCGTVGSRGHGFRRQWRGGLLSRCPRASLNCATPTPEALEGVVIVSDGAGQFRIAEHALCWVHAERLIHKLDTVCKAHVQAKERIRARIWRLYKDFKAYRQTPTSRAPVR